MVEIHVRQALDRIESNVIAAATPDDFIDVAWLDEFFLLADDLWSFGITTVDDLFRIRHQIALPPSARINGIAHAAIEDARESYLTLLRHLVNKHAYSLTKEPIFGEFRKGDLIQYGDVRGLLVKLGGGPAEPGVDLQGGITTGRFMREYLREGGIDTDQKIWLYGWEEQPRRTFNGHLQMDGLVFEAWDDNGLIIAPQDVWLRRNYYAPGDHWGCACVVAPYFPNFGEPFQI